MALIGDHFLGAAQIEALRPRVTFTMCHLWSIRLTDGTTLRYASHDKPVTHEGQTYIPMGPTAQNAQTEEAGGQSDFEIFGFLSHQTIRPRDIQMGKFNGAMITQTTIDWERPWIWTRKHKWWVKSIVVDGDVFKAEVGGVDQFLEIKTGRYYEKECDKTFAGSECQATPTTLTSKTVTAVPSTSGGEINGTTRDTRALRVETGAIANLASGEKPMWQFGSVEFLTGGNKGKNIQIFNAEYVEAATPYLDLTLSISTPYPIRVNDTVTIRSGCDGAFSTCRLVYENTINFGGVHKMPTTEDQYVQPELDNTQEV